MPQSLFRRTLILVGTVLWLTACGEPDHDADDEGGSTDEYLHIEGTVLEIARAASAILVEDADGHMWSISTAGDTAIIPGEGVTGGRLEVLPGLPVRVSGARVSRDRARADSIVIKDTPPVILVQPRPRTALTRAVIPIEGFSHRGGTVRYRLVRGDSLIAEGSLTTEALGLRRYAPFSGQLTLPHYASGADLAVEVWRDADDDAEPVRRTVHFAAERALNLYYPSREADPERLRCDAVYPIQRRAPVLMPPSEVAALLMEEPPSSYRRRGYFSDVARFEEITKVEIQEERALIDLREPGAGFRLDSCQVVAAKAQLERTLGEAFGVTTVEVTVGGVPLVAGRGR